MTRSILTDRLIDMTNSDDFSPALRSAHMVKAQVQYESLVELMESRLTPQMDMEDCIHLVLEALVSLVECTGQQITVLSAHELKFINQELDEGTRLDDTAETPGGRGGSAQA